MKHALVTGAAGFIGSHLVDRLLASGWQVTGLDNFDPFYDPLIKQRNIVAHERHVHYRLFRNDIRDIGGVQRALGDRRIDVIVHLAAKAGVRPSIGDPVGYQSVNVEGTQAMLEVAKNLGVRQFVFGSSSSVYGVNPNVPWHEDDHVLLPISPYASTKISGELLGHVYSHLHGIRFIALRFFTVYGPRQRPDLAIHKFARLILRGEPIPVFGDGTTRRDYTFVRDVVDAIVAAMDYAGSTYERINIGNNRTVTLSEMIAALEDVLGVRARIARRLPVPGDVPQTWASVDRAFRLLSYQPRTPFVDGLREFAGWMAAIKAGPAPVGDSP